MPRISLPRLITSMQLAIFASSGGGPGHAPDVWTAGGSAEVGAGTTVWTARCGALWNSPRQVRNMPSRNPTATAVKPTAITRRASCSGETLATSPTSDPVVAVSVWDFVQDSFQIAVLRSNVKSALGADVITCGSVTANVTMKIDAISSWEIICCSPGAGVAIGVGAVLKE